MATTTADTVTIESTAEKRAVVTGASSGIGRASAVALAADGWRIVAMARRVEKLDSLASELNGQYGDGTCEAVACDITDEDSTQAAVDTALVGGPVKALVNCAGAAFGKDTVENSSLDDWRNMYELDVLGTLRITQKLLPALKAAPGGGTVLIVSSTAGIEPYEGGSGYCAAKSAERVMARVLRLEQIGEPLRVIDVAPGMVKTDEFSRKRFGGDQTKADAVYQGVPSPLTAEDVAESVRWAMAQPDTVDIDSIVVRPRAEGSYTKVDRR